MGLLGFRLPWCWSLKVSFLARPPSGGISLYIFLYSKSLAASVLAHKLNTGCALVPCVCPGAPPSGNRSSGLSILLIQYYFHREKLSLKESSSKKITKILFQKEKNIQRAFWLLFFARFKDLIFNRRRDAIWGLCRSSPGPQTMNSKNRSET